MSLIFSSLVFISFLIIFIYYQKLDLVLFVVAILSAGIGLPIFGITIGFLRWWWDYSVTRRNFNSFPFSQLSSLGFEKTIKNEGSKIKYISEYYLGKINGFIVDCDVDTQYESTFLRFKYYVKTKQIEKSDFRRIQQEFKAQNGAFNFDWISKKYHYKNHRIKSVSELERDLIDFSNLILKEHIEPCDLAKR